MLTPANTMFQAEFSTAIRAMGRIAGKMRIHLIPILPGEKVLLEISPYDLTKGRITFRQK